MEASGVTMKKFSGTALFMVLTISLILGILCSSLILMSYYYRLQYQKKERWSLLERNLNSSITLSLHSDPKSYQEGEPFSLFREGSDSVRIQQRPWGLYTISQCQSFIQKDSLSKVFLVGNTLDSEKSAALYMIDENRPVGVSGNTSISGDVFVPKAGIKDAYVSDIAYTGDKAIVKGRIKNSNRSLPSLDSTQLENFLSFLKNKKGPAITLHAKDSVIQSFFSPTKVIYLGKRVVTLSGNYIQGNVILLSDTLLNLDSTVHCKDALIVAKSLVLLHGFRGSGQFFAKDSIHIGQNATLEYPSTLGVFSLDKRALPTKLVVEKNCLVEGTIFSYSSPRTTPPGFVDLGKNIHIMGHLYVRGVVRFFSGGNIRGGIFVDRVLYTSGNASYENYLINLQLDSKTISKNYLTSPIFPFASTDKKVLKWLEKK